MLAWRNDPSTRDASHDKAEITFQSHLQWLKKTLENGERQLYIVEIEGRPVGTVRADHENPGYELSWTVAPDSRGQGVGKHMVQLLMEKLSGPVRAEVKVGNIASARIAEAAGMSLVRKANGVMHYQRV